MPKVANMCPLSASLRTSTKTLSTQQYTTILKPLGYDESESEYVINPGGNYVVTVVPRQ